MKRLLSGLILLATAPLDSPALAAPVEKRGATGVPLVTPENLKPAAMMERFSPALDPFLK